MSEIENTKQNICALFVSRHDDSDTTTRNVAEPDMESTEIVSDNEKHAERFLGILNLRQEIWREAERQSNFGGLVKVRLEDMPKASISLHKPLSGRYGHTC